MSVKANWRREQARRWANQHGTASVYRVGPTTRPKARMDTMGDETVRTEPDALWTFMREPARCEVEQLPIPLVPRDALDRIGVTSQSLALAWICRIART